MSNHKICFCREIKKNIMWIHLLSGAVVRMYVTFCVFLIYRILFITCFIIVTAMIVLLWP